MVVFSFSGPHDVHPTRLYLSVANGRWFCNTLERVGYQIPALCYHLAVTMSPKFRRLLPIVQNVPSRSGIRFHRGTRPEHSTGCILVLGDNGAGGNNKDNLNTPCARPTLALAKTKDVISPLPLSNVGEAELLSRLSLNHTIPVGCRSAADVEQSLTQLLLNAQNNHEEIILEVTDFRSGTELGYNTPCPPELQMP